MPVAADVELQDVALEEARRVLAQFNVDPDNLARHQGFSAPVGVDRLCWDSKTLVELAIVSSHLPHGDDEPEILSSSTGKIRFQWP
jgi:hypothetical protein